MRRFERAGGGAGLDAVLLDPLEVLPHFFFSTAQLGNVQVTGGPLTTLSGFDYFSLEITPTTPGGQVPEPATAVLLTLGDAALTLARRRRAS